MTKIEERIQGYILKALERTALRGRKTIEARERITDQIAHHFDDRDFARRRVVAVWTQLEVLGWVTFIHGVGWVDTTAAAHRAAEHVRPVAARIRDGK